MLTQFLGRVSLMDIYPPSCFKLRDGKLLQNRCFPSMDFWSLYHTHVLKQKKKQTCRRNSVVMLRLNMAVNHTELVFVSCTFMPSKNCIDVFRCFSSDAEVGRRFRGQLHVYVLLLQLRESKTLLVGLITAYKHKLWPHLSSEKQLVLLLPLKRFVFLAQL